MGLNLTNKLIFLLLISCLVPFLIPVQRVNGMAIQGQLGNYLQMFWISVDDSQMEFPINATIGLDMTLLAEKDIFVKAVVLGIYDDYHNMTSGLVSNYTLAENTFWKSDQYILFSVSFKSRRIGLMYLSINASYEFNDGNQTVEGGGQLYVFDIANIVQEQRWQLEQEIEDLQIETYQMNLSIQSLDLSCLTFQERTYFFASTTVISIAAVPIAVIIYKRKHNKQSPDSMLS